MADQFQPRVWPLPHEEPLPEPQAGTPSPVFLALSGGGVDGIAHLGVARVLHALHDQYPIDTIVGTSAGSDAGAVIASGMSDDDAKTAMFNFDYKALTHGNWLQRLPVVGVIVGSAVNLVRQFGIFDGTPIATQMDKILSK